MFFGSFDFFQWKSNYLSYNQLRLRKTFILADKVAAYEDSLSFQQHFIPEGPEICKKLCATV